jgi:hypothetical protein
MKHVALSYISPPLGVIDFRHLSEEAMEVLTMERTIVPAAMRRNDRYTMASFLDSVPEVAAHVEQFLQARGSLPVPTFRHFHHKKSLKASYVAATGERLVCFTVMGLTSGQAKLIDAKLSENERWDLPAFRAAVSHIMCEPPYRQDEVDIEPAPAGRRGTRACEPTT